MTILMDPDPIEKRVQKLIMDQIGCGEEEVVPSARFIEDIGCDSLDTVELVMAAEEEFHIEIPDNDAEQLLTVEKAIAYLTRRTS